MLDELKKKGELQSIINKAVKESKGVAKHLGRGSGRGLAAFLDVTTKTKSDNSFQPEYKCTVECFGSSSKCFRGRSYQTLSNASGVEQKRGYRADDKKWQLIV